MTILRNCWPVLFNCSLRSEMSSTVFFYFWIFAKISSPIFLILLIFVWINRRTLHLSKRLPNQNGHFPFIGALTKLIGADDKGFLIK